ncbi:MAG: hypothetical protein ABSG25_10925 [Bryobacteraceae bacterium]
MPDQLCLSIWLRSFSGETMLRRFEDMLRAFPFSRLRPGISTFRVHAIDYSEAPLIEHAFGQDADIEAVLELAGDFENPDCAYTLECWWDLFQYQQDWKLPPSRVTLVCHGPQFETVERDHLRVEFGPEEAFLPQPGVPGAAMAIESNLKSVLRLAHDLEQSLPVERRSLWSESGENFVDRLDEAFSE